jgi:DNA-binding MarR family transcriptional regulator
MPKKPSEIGAFDAESVNALTRLFELAARSLHSAGHSHGLYPAQWTALRYFSVASPAERTSSALARFQQMAVGPVTRTVRTLITKGLLIKGGAGVHHRAERLDLTEAGRTILAQDPLLGLNAVVAKLNTEQSSVLAGVLGQIIATLNSIEDAGDDVVFDKTLIGDDPQ